MKRVLLGKITGVYGVRGWVKVHSDTAPKENILDYSPWQVRIGSEWRTLTLTAGRRHNRGLVGHLQGCDDRDTARTLVGADIAVLRSQLAATEEDEYYWADLVGCRVVTREGQELGHVDHLLETGANDVLVISGERERLIPFLQGRTVTAVDVAAGVIEVDWNPDWDTGP